MIHLTKPWKGSAKNSQQRASTSGTFSKKKNERKVQRLSRYDEAILAVQEIILSGDQEAIARLEAAIREIEEKE